MERQKEEAVRAMDMAERKMQEGDFEGARSIVLEAQKLYSDLENITQSLTVCDVHCSAKNKLNGTEMDWYGILQVERFSDKSVILKQFRTLALSLHPDKNQLPGAESAFKMIEEARKLLTDATKRRLYDMRFRGLMESETKTQEGSKQRKEPSVFVKVELGKCGTSMLNSCLSKRKETETLTIDKRKGERKSESESEFSRRREGPNVYAKVEFGGRCTSTLNSTSLKRKALTSDNPKKDRKSKGESGVKLSAGGADRSKVNTSSSAEHSVTSSDEDYQPRRSSRSNSHYSKQRRCK